MARGGGIRIPAILDADGVKRGAREAEAALARLNATTESRFGKMSAAAKAAAVGGVAVLGAGMIKLGVDSVKAAQDAEASMARTRKMVEAAGISWEKHAGQIDKASQAAARKGFDDEKAAESIARLTSSTKDVNEAIRLNAIAMDVARGRNLSLEQATNLVVKAHMGQAGAVRRLGIDVDKSATSQQLLAAMQQKFAGQADAYGRTTAGAADRLRASWENFQESVGQKVLPILARLLQRMADFADWMTANWPRIWADVRRYAQPILEWLGPLVKNVMGVVQGAVELVVNILQGDWKEAWGGVKRVVSNALSGLGKLAGLAGKAGMELGKALAQGLWDMITAAFDKLKAKITGWVDDVKAKVDGMLGGTDAFWNRATAATRTTGAFAGATVTRASGGYIPGNPATGDSVPAMLTPGEVVLNRRQQALLGADRIMHVLARTGGKIGMGGFATGGVAAAADFARRQLGEPYVWGGGHFVGDPYGWDCSGFASNVAARVPGYTGGIGTTKDLYPKSKPARGDEPVVFGFLGMNQSNPAKQHMGIRVNGEWFEAAGGGRGVIRGRSSWSSGLRIPPGLEYLAGAGAGGGIGSDIGGNPSPLDAPDRPTAAERAKAKVTRSIAAALKGLPSFDESGRSASPSGAAATGVTSQVTRAGRAAISAGQSPDQVREVMDDTQRNAEIGWVRTELVAAKTERSRVAKAIVETRKRLKAAAKKVPKKGAARAAALQVVAAIRKKLGELQDAMAGVNAWIAELNARALELDIAAAEDALEGQPTTSTVSDPGQSPADQAVASPDPNLQAIADQANRRAEVAQAGQAAADQFIRTALSPGDISQVGARSAWQAVGGSVNVTIQTLAPGDPTTLQAIQQAVARALGSGSFTPATAVSVGL